MNKKEELLWRKMLELKGEIESPSSRKCLYALDRRDRKRRYKVVFVLEDIKGYFNVGFPGMKTLEETKKVVSDFNKKYFNVSNKKMMEIVSKSMQAE